MTRKTLTFRIFWLIMLSLFAGAVSAGEPATEFPVIRVEEHGQDVIFATSEAISALMDEESLLRSELPSVIVAKMERRVRELTSFQDYRRRSGHLTESGCHRLSEKLLYSQESSFLTQDSEESPQKVSMQELMQRAEVALTVEVLRKDAVWVYGRFQGLVQAKVKEVLRPGLLPFQEGEEVRFLERPYDLEFRGQFFCAERPGFHRSSSGDLLLLLATNDQPIATILVPVNVFPLDGSLVRPQHYFFLEESAEPVRLPEFPRDE